MRKTRCFNIYDNFEEEVPEATEEKIKDKITELIEKKGNNGMYRFKAMKITSDKLDDE